MTEDPLLGQTVLGKYRIDRLIGSGGMGTVFSAEDLRLGRPVAIKILRPAGGDFGDVGRRFRREARTVAQVTHPNLVTLLEFDLLEDGTPAMVMERVDGRSLRDLMETRAFTVFEVQEVLRQCLSALAACHEAGIVHRDLKPGNILLEDKGGELHAKIIDFGLTKVLNPGHSVLTAQGEVFGSPRFMAPEQWLARDVDGRTDLYALGLIGYCLLLGRHFIQPGNPVDVCRAHVQQPRPVITHDSAGNPVPAGLNECLRKATSPKPEGRYPDAIAMRAALLGQTGAMRISLGSQDALRVPAALMPARAPQTEEPAEEAAPTLVDEGLAAQVEAAMRAEGLLPPEPTLDGGESSDLVIVSLDVDTRPVPAEAANAIRTIDRAEFEAALRATAEQQRPVPSAVAAEDLDNARTTPVTPVRPTAPLGTHPSRRPAPTQAAPPPAAAPAAEPPEEADRGLPPWLLIVAGLLAAGITASVVLLLK